MKPKEKVGAQVRSGLISQAALFLEGFADDGVERSRQRRIDLPRLHHDLAAAERPGQNVSATYIPPKTPNPSHHARLSARR